MKKIAEFKGLKYFILMFLCYVSFCISTYFNAKTMFSSSNILICILYVLGCGFLYYIIFESLLFLFYLIQNKEFKININITNFKNIFRFLFIFFNLLYFLIFNILLMLNFFTSYFLLLFCIVTIYTIFVLAFIILKKMYNLKNSIFYFSYCFIFLVVFVLMWGIV